MVPHLRESEGRYRTLFDLASIAVYSCDGSINLPCVERQQDSIVACAYEAFTDVPRISKY